MGCTSSKLDDLPAVILCKERCNFLEMAIRERFAFAEAHMAYTQSLKQIGPSLHEFIDKGGGAAGGESILSSPPLKKGGADPKPNPIESSKKLQHSNSDGHIEFNSDSEDDDDHDDCDGHSHGHLSSHSSPSRDHHLHGNFDYPVNYNHQQVMDHETLERQGGFGYGGFGGGAGGGGGGGYGGFDGGGGGFTHMNFMRKSATPSNVYQQRPMSPESLHQVSDYQYPHQAYPYPNSGYGGGGGPAGGGGSYNYGSSSSSRPSAQTRRASTSKPPPPPPSPPRVSTWDFLNPFESYEKFYPSYNTPSRDSKSVREEEGIPDLEDEVYHHHHQQHHEVVKEVHGDQKFLAEHHRDPKGFLQNEESSDDHDSDDDIHDDEDHDDHDAGGNERRKSEMENDRVEEYEVHVVDKKVVDDGERGTGESSKTTAFKPGSRDADDVAMEIEVQFVRASESLGEIATLLEVGKVPYQRKHVSKMLHVVTPSLSVISSQPSTSKSARPSTSGNQASPALLDNTEEELIMRSKTLSATLQKLYLWENKLYNEVKAEEKMRVFHDRKCGKLKRLDERGAEASKIDATRTLVRSLSTKIRIAIQVVDKISVTINKIRDNELWPQLNVLIQGLTKMWKSVFECNHIQCIAIKEARGLGSVGAGKMLSDAHLETTLRFEHELLNWTFRFSSWVRAQKGYVRALNGWLLKCLLYEPEETADGFAPFSPGRMGAPPVFVICHQWSQALDRISEKEVIESMRIFAMTVFHHWEQDKKEMKQRMMANKELERRVRNLDREDHKIQKEIQALDKKVIMISRGGGGSLSVTGNAVYQSDTSTSLQGSLKRIFEAMERFTAESVKAYEELLQRSQEEMTGGEQRSVS